MAELTLERVEQLERESGPMKHPDAIVQLKCSELAELLCIYRSMRQLGEQLMARGAVRLVVPKRKG